MRVWQRRRQEDAERLAAIRARIRQSLDDPRPTRSRKGRSGSPTSSTVAATMRPCSGATTRPLRAGMNNQSQGPSRPHIFHDSGLGKRFPNL
jgi:hypothetical protein